METLATKIKALRKANGYTQKDLANIMGVNVSTISRIESGEINSLKQDALEKLAKTVGISGTSFFSDFSSFDDVLKDKLNQQLCENYEKADEKIKKAVNVLLDL